MGVIPTPLDWAANAGNSPSAATWQAGVGDPLKFLIDPPRCAIRNTGAQSIPTGAFTALTFNTEDYDPNDSVTALSMHSLAANLSRMTAQVPGTYFVTGMCSFTGNATGRRGLRWRVNGAATMVPGGQTIVAATTAGNVQIPAVSMYISLALNDYVELEAFQDSGAALLTVVSVAEAQPYASARLVGP